MNFSIKFRLIILEQASKVAECALQGMQTYLPHMTRWAPKFATIWDRMSDKSRYGNGILETLNKALNFTYTCSLQDRIQETENGRAKEMELHTKSTSKEITWSRTNSARQQITSDKYFNSINDLFAILHRIQCLEILLFVIWLIYISKSENKTHATKIIQNLSGTNLWKSR